MTLANTPSTSLGTNDVSRDAGGGDMGLTAGQRARVRRLSEPQAHDASDAGGELNVVPFLDIVMNVLMFVLATLPAVFTSTVALAPPHDPSCTLGPVHPSLNLTMMVVGDGVALKASGGAVAPGCEGLGGGVTVPNKDGRYDWTALNSCVQKLKQASPDFAAENNVRVIAEPGIDYQTVVQAMDAVRKDGQGDPLFPDVTFGVVK